MNTGLGLSLYMGLIMSGFKDYYLNRGMKITDYGKYYRVIILKRHDYLYINLKNSTYSTDNTPDKTYIPISKDTLGYLRALTVE